MLLAISALFIKEPQLPCLYVWLVLVCMHIQMYMFRGLLIESEKSLVTSPER